jgi:hypothetical protein
VLLWLTLAGATFAAAQAPTLTRFRVTPLTAAPGARVAVQLHFNRIGQAMPILTSTNPRIFNPGGNWRTNGSSMITRTVTLGTTDGCSTVRAHWGGRNLDQRVCVERPAPPQPQLCSEFSLRSPGNNASFTTRRVTLSWNSCANATNYRVMMRRTNETPVAVAQSTNTNATFDVPASFGDNPSWYIEASRGSARRNSNDSRRIRFTSAPPADPTLTWDSTITQANFPGLASWPNNFRQRVEGQHSIKSIVESRVVVRGDGQLCSACHFTNGPRLYRPQGQQNQANSILSTTTIPRNFQQQGSWSNLFANEFLANGNGSQPSAGVKPSSLRDLIQKWVQDGRRP